MKVQEAMATATPVVATSTANRGVGGLPGRDLLVAGYPTDFATAVGSLLGDYEARERLGRAGRAYVAKLQLGYPLSASYHRSISPSLPRPDRLNVMYMVDVTGRGGAEGPRRPGSARRSVAVQRERVRHQERGELPADARRRGCSYIYTWKAHALGNAQDGPARIFAAEPARTYCSTRTCSARTPGAGCWAGWRGCR